MIEVRDLKKSYGSVQALRGVSFEAERGEIIGLLGPNGAGKSTAMRILTGYLAPSSGSAKVMGHEVVDDPLAAQQHIGYLPEGNPLYLELRLVEALRFAAEMRGLRGAARNAAIGDAIEAAGLQGKERSKIVTLSRGYRQRVGLAQALLHKPPILILDEPSSGLDPNQQTEMRRLIRGLGERCAVIFSTHILPEVSAICDRAVVIAEGRLVAAGTRQDIIEQAGLPTGLEVNVRGDREAIDRVLTALPFGKEVVWDDADVETTRTVRVAVDGGVDQERLVAVASALREAGATWWGLQQVETTFEEAFAAVTLGKAPKPDSPSPTEEHAIDNVAAVIAEANDEEAAS